MTTEPSFTWCDLSTFRPQVTKAFYSRLFGWRFEGSDDYDYALLGETQIAALFEMPETMRQIGMPSFWMSYVSVGNVARTVAKARELGARIELEDPAYALIRDPLGAGFTVHGGLRPPAPSGHGTRAGHAYLCSDLLAIQPFYQALFGWTYRNVGGDTWQIATATGDPVCFAYQQPDEIRGKEQYWAILFAVDDLDAAPDTAIAAGGTGCQPVELYDRPARLIYDPDGAALFLVSLP
ncbi:MAG: VOC family protein [Pseudomonadota bacterium]